MDLGGQGVGGGGEEERGIGTVDRLIISPLPSPPPPPCDDCVTGVASGLGKNFTVEPRGGMVGVGESFYLPCQIQASPHDLMVVWEKDASLLKVDDK